MFSYSKGEIRVVSERFAKRKTHEHDHKPNALSSASTVTTNFTIAAIHPICESLLTTNTELAIEHQSSLVKNAEDLPRCQTFLLPALINNLVRYHYYPCTLLIPKNRSTFSTGPSLAGRKSGMPSVKCSNQSCPSSSKTALNRSTIVERNMTADTFAASPESNNTCFESNGDSTCNRSAASATFSLSNSRMVSHPL